jgi:peptide/nickel transport system substrate-binding protein
MAVDRNEIIDRVLYGYGTEESSPIPQSSTITTSNTTSTDRIGDAKALLAKNGWKLNAQGVMEKKNKKQTQNLSFTITTSNNPDLTKTAEILKEEWNKIGANVTVVTLDPSELNQNVIRPRKYDVLLFGEVVGRGSDLYPFWHSSERKDPGLNIALYTNSNADKLLEKIRASTNATDATKSLSSLQSMIASDVPAIFIYSPELTYVVPKELKNMNLPSLEITSERWIGIFEAYLKTKTVWN